MPHTLEKCLQSDHVVAFTTRSAGVGGQSGNGWPWRGFNGSVWRGAVLVRPALSRTPGARLLVAARWGISRGHKKKPRTGRSGAKAFNNSVEKATNKVLLKCTKQAATCRFATTDVRQQ